MVYGFLRFRLGFRGCGLTIGAEIITHTISGVPCCSYSIIGSKTLF